MEMYVSIGPGAAVPQGEIVGVFDLDNVTWSHRTRKSLEVCEKGGRVRSAGEDLPRSFVLTAPRKRRGPRRACRGAFVWLTPLSPATVARRFDSEQI